jgi:transcriptional regulator with XRE-family HTH domain
MATTAANSDDRCMNELQGIPPKYARQLARARARLTVADEVGLALRDHRRALGLSQRAYAASRGLSRAMLARLEAGAGRMSLDTVVSALEGTGFELRVAFDSPPPTMPEATVATPSTSAQESAPSTDVGVPPEAWLPTDLVARVRGGSRRFPAHRVVEPVVNPPLWWWMHEFFSGPTEQPQWYAPVCHLDLLRSPKQPSDSSSDVA